MYSTYNTVDYMSVSYTYIHTYLYEWQQRNTVTKDKKLLRQSSSLCATKTLSIFLNYDVSFGLCGEFYIS